MHHSLKTVLFKITYYCTHIPRFCPGYQKVGGPLSLKFWLRWSTRLYTTLLKLSASKLCVTAPPTSQEPAWDIRLYIWPIVLKRLTVCWDVMKLRFKLYYVHDDKTRLLTCSSLMMIGNPGASYCPWQWHDFFGGPPLLLQLLRRVHLWDRIHVHTTSCAPLKPSINLFSSLERILSDVDDPHTYIQISDPSTFLVDHHSSFSYCTEIIFMSIRVTLVNTWSCPCPEDFNR